jgi:hypothetical protein
MRLTAAAIVSALLVGSVGSARSQQDTIRTGAWIAEGTRWCANRESISELAPTLRSRDQTAIQRAIGDLPICFSVGGDVPVYEVVARSSGIVAVRFLMSEGPIDMLSWLLEEDVQNIDSASVVLVDETAPIALLYSRTSTMPKSPNLGEYSDYVRLELVVRNNTNQQVRAWRAVLVARDPFGEEMFRVELTGGRANIPPGDVREARFQFDDNEFIENEPYDYLAAYDSNTIDLLLTDIQVAY